MKVQQQIIKTVNTSTLDFIPGFTEKFEHNIKVLTININFGFEIVLFGKFQDDEKLKKRIKKFINRVADIDDVQFFSDTLPF